MIIKGKAIFKCPETGEEVRVDKECTNKDGKGENCPYYKHWSWEGARPLLACNYPEKFAKYVEDTVKEL